MPLLVLPVSHGEVLVMQLSGLVDVVQNYDAMLIDQYGVLHDGHKLYPNVLDALAKLHKSDVPVVILTNSGKRAEYNIERLLRLGIPRSYFVNCMSSGELCYQTLSARKVKMIGRSGEDYGFTGVEDVDSVDDAEVVLILGSDAPRLTLDDYCTFLQPYVRKSIPAICCNPDLQMITKTGIEFAPGAIAALYQEMGGHVRWVGKPYADIYHAASALIGRPARVLCIGDSPEHDIAGGQSAGFDTLLVMTGLSQDRDASQTHPAPNYIMESFRWTNSKN